MAIKQWFCFGMTPINQIGPKCIDLQKNQLCECALKLSSCWSNPNAH
jgi:hypothetical protein